MPLLPILLFCVASEFSLVPVALQRSAIQDPAPTQEQDAHQKLNPLYHALRHEGFPLQVQGKSTKPGKEGLRVKLPAPRLLDGQSAARQQQMLRSLLGEDYRMEDFTRNSPVAPFRLRLSDATPSDPLAPTRFVDVTFIAHGDLKTLQSKAFLDRVLDTNTNKEGKARTLTQQQLAQRKIPLPDSKQEGYTYLVLQLLDRVELRAVGHAYYSQTANSVLVAGRLDPRFREDPTYNNVWLPLVRGSSGFKPSGNPTPYDSAAYYVKISRLDGMFKGALFVECYILFAEPRGWFDGANLLRSKLPPVLQNQIRTFRRAL